MVGDFPFNAGVTALLLGPARFKKSGCGMSQPIKMRRKVSLKMEDVAKVDEQVQENNVNDDNAAQNNEPEIDYTKIDPEKIPHDVIQNSNAFKGLLHETQTLRENQAALNAQMEMLQQKEPAKDPDPFDNDDFDPDEPVTMGQLKNTLSQVLTAEQKKQQAEKQQTEAQQRAQLQEQSTARLLKDKSVKNCPKGLDGETVLRQGGQWLKQHKPQYVQAALNSADPAAEIYDLALKYCPDLVKIQATTQNNQLLNSLQNPKVPGNAGGGDEDMSTLETLMDMPLDQIDAQLAKELEVE